MPLSLSEAGCRVVIDVRKVVDVLGSQILHTPHTNHIWYEPLTFIVPLLGVPLDMSQ